MEQPYFYQMFCLSLPAFILEQNIVQIKKGIHNTQMKVTFMCKSSLWEDAKLGIQNWQLSVLFLIRETGQDRLIKDGVQMDSHKKAALYFVGYFVVFSIIFIISSFIWKAMILNKEITIVAADALSIIGIYYLIISIISLFVYIRHIKSLLSQKQLLVVFIELTESDQFFYYAVNGRRI